MKVYRFQQEPNPLSIAESCVGNDDGFLKGDITLPPFQKGDFYMPPVSSVCKGQPLREREFIEGWQLSKV